MAYMLVLIDTRGDSVVHRKIRNDPHRVVKAMNEFVLEKFGPDQQRGD